MPLRDAGPLGRPGRTAAAAGAADDADRVHRFVAKGLLEPFRGKVPDEVFGEVFMAPVSDGSGQDRALLRRDRSPFLAARCARRRRLSWSDMASIR